METAKFKIKDAFTISSRGYVVIAGVIVEGEISNGNQIVLDDRLETIKSVESFCSSGDNRYDVGLIIESTIDIKQYKNLIGHICSIVIQYS